MPVTGLNMYIIAIASLLLLPLYVLPALIKPVIISHLGIKGQGRTYEAKCMKLYIFFIDINDNFN